jgi:hypothetical protein
MAAVVRVVPFTPAAGKNLSSVVASMMEELSTNGDVTAVGQAVASLASALNMEGSVEEEVERKRQEDEAIEALQREREVDAARLQTQREVEVAAMDVGEAEQLRLEWEAEDARIKAEQTVADVAEAEHKQWQEERRQAEELEAATRTRDVLMNALLAPPPPPPPCTAAADGEACQNSGVVIGTEGVCSCDCAGTGFGGSSCQAEVSCTTGAGGNACDNAGVVVGTTFCSCNCLGTGFDGSNCQIPLVCTTGADGGACQNSGLPQGTGRECSCNCAGTGFSGTQCTMSTEAVGRASQILGQVTAKPDQLSPESTDKALNYVSAFDVAALGEGAVESVANVMSNLLKASASQFGAKDNVLELERRWVAEEAEAQRLAGEREAEAVRLQAERVAEIAAMDAAELASKQAEWEADDARIREQQVAEDARSKAEAAEVKRLQKEEEAKARSAQLEAVVDSLASSLASRLARSMQCASH